MCAMILRLDPRRAIVWRDPRTVQLGVDPVIAVIDDMGDGEARLLGALSTGVTRDGLTVLADLAGVSNDRVERMLTLLQPALAPPPSDEPRPRIAVIGDVTGTARIARLLSSAGFRVVTASTGESLDSSGVAAAVLVSHHVVEPLEHLRWLNRDVLHVPVVFGELAVTIGPVVSPGLTPCIACVEQQRTDADPAWPAIGPQLWRTQAAADTELAATGAALELVRLLADRPAYQVRLDGETGMRSERTWQPSPRCGCRGLELTALTPIAAG
jgi:hypothetical protein